jgi:hypothetical protein
MFLLRFIQIIIAHIIKVLSSKRIDTVYKRNFQYYIGYINITQITKILLYLSILMKHIC